MRRALHALWTSSSLPHEIWNQRHRWLLGILWAHVAALAVYAGFERGLGGSTGPFAIAAAAFALLATATLRTPPSRVLSALPALGLLCAAVAFDRVWSGAAEVAFHSSLVIVLLMLYEDRFVLLLAVAFLVAQFALRGVPLETATIHTLFGAAVAITALAVVGLNASLRSRAHEATQRFRSSFDNAPIGMAVVSVDGRFEDVNPALCQIAGYARDALLARRLQDIMLPEDLDREGDVVREMLRLGRRTSQRQMRFLHSDGSSVWVNLSVSLVSHAKDAPAHFVVQAEDITDRKRGEERL